MSAGSQRSENTASARSDGWLFRCRLREPRLRACLRTRGRPERRLRLATGTSRSGVKRTQCAGRNQNRQLMRGGRT